MIAQIEMPAGTTLKMEMTKTVPPELFVDRELSMPVPFSYGYIIHTLAADGDPLDVFVLSKDPIPAMTYVPIELLGVFLCTDNGVDDEKIIAKIAGSPTTWLGIVQNEIEHYLSNYKPGFKVLGYASADFAADIVRKYRND